MSSGALALVIASSKSLTRLTETRQYSQAGSPFLNFFEEITLSGFPPEEIYILLDHAKERFSDEDNQFIISVSGGHPYLLQAAASELWELYEYENDPYPRREKVGTRLLSKTELLMNHTWKRWSDAVKFVFALVGIFHAPGLLKRHDFDKKEIMDILSDYRSELRELEREGFIKEDIVKKQWVIGSLTFLWWLLEELARDFRKKEKGTLYPRLMQKDEEVSNKKKKKSKLFDTAQLMGDLIKDGISTLIKAAVQGAMNAI